MSTETVWILRWGYGQPNRIAGLYSSRDRAMHNALALSVVLGWKIDDTKIAINRPGFVLYSYEDYYEDKYISIEQTQVDIDIEEV